MLLCVHLGGCTTWQPVQIGPSEFIAAEEPYEIRLRDYSGDWLYVEYPLAQGDSIAGSTKVRNQSNGRMTTVPIRIAVTADLLIEAKRPNTPQTVIAVAAVTSIVLGAILCVTGVLCGREIVNVGGTR